MSHPIDAYIVEAVRTPIGRGRAGGAFCDVHPVGLLAATVSEVVERAGIPKSAVEDVIAGCVTPIGDQGWNVGRLALLQAGFPIEVPGMQLNRFCGSGQQAVHFAAQSIRSGDIDIAIGCGVESMSRVPMGSDGKISPEFAAAFPYEIVHQGISAEMLAEKWNLRRREIDEYAAMSHCRAAAAARARWTGAEIFPLTVRSNGTAREVTADEGIRPNPDLAKLGLLPTVFKPDGVITAGNSSQISDGAAAVLLASGRKADEMGLRKRARIVAQVVVGSDPVIMLTGPIDATRKALAKARLTIDQIDAVEINEAFATVVLAWAREIHPPMERVNIQGGAIAHGHPLGATGAVLMTKLVNILERTGGRYGLQTMCIGFGMATATIIERCPAGEATR